MNKRAKELSNTVKKLDLKEIKFSNIKIIIYNDFISVVYKICRDKEWYTDYGTFYDSIYEFLKGRDDSFYDEFESTILETVLD